LQNTDFVVNTSIILTQSNLEEKMAQYKSMASNVEVNGQTVLSVIDAMSIKRRGLQILAENGINDPKPDQWYKQQNWLDAFRTIGDEIGPSVLYSIGRAIPENAQFPPQIDNIEKALSAIDVAYHMNHRGGEIGTYGYEKIGDKQIKMVCKNPYPCDFDRGIIESMAKKFKPQSSAIVRVKHDDSAPCRKSGGDSCTYHITW